MYYLFHGNFPDVELFFSHSYIHLVEEVPEECLFYHTEAPD